MYFFFAWMWLVFGIYGLWTKNDPVYIIGLVNCSVWAVGNGLSKERW